MRRRRQSYPHYDLILHLLFLLTSWTHVIVNSFTLVPPPPFLDHRSCRVAANDRATARTVAPEYHPATTLRRNWSTRHKKQSFSLFGVVVVSEDEEDPEIEDDNEDEDDEEEEQFIPVQLPDDYFESMEMPYDLSDLQQLTVPELKQQLRLRNLKVSGRKDELIQRLLLQTTQSSSSSSLFAGATALDDGSVSGTRASSKPAAAKDKAATMNTKESKKKKKQTVGKTTSKTDSRFVDVAEYLDPQDRGKHVKTATIGADKQEEEEEDSTPIGGGGGIEEVWGADARIVEDYEGRRVVVDSLSRTVVEFTGSNQTAVSAYCVASRDALQPFLAGGGRTLLASNSNNNNNNNASASVLSAAAIASASEEKLQKIQSQREQASRRAIHWEDQSGIDEGDETGIFKDILNRDFSDWGKYTPTGAHLSASEVQGVLLLSDVYGAFAPDTQALAEKIAFECQPVVVLVPDLFRGEPWTGPTEGRNQRGQKYEEWRSLQSDLRVSIDIRAAAACLRERYGCSSVVVWGTCYGGGRALEVASGWLPGEGNIHDVDGSIGPPPVDSMACVAWYPTRYNAYDLFGKTHKGTSTNLDGTKRQIAVMAVFAGNDNIPGATSDDAATLKMLLEQDDRVRDHMVKIFPGQDHGFAHVGISQTSTDSQDPYDRFVDDEFGGSGRVSMGGSDAEVACLLSTAFMETYSRVFLPTVGPPISLDEHESEWSNKLEMNDLSKANGRDVRQEIQDALDNFVEEPLSGKRIDPTDPSQEEELKKLLRSMQDLSAETGTNAITPDDDLATIYTKLLAQDGSFQLF